MLDDLVEIECTRREKNADDGKRQRNFVTDHLRGAAQAAQQRVLAVRRPSRQRHAINANRSDREKEQQPDVAVRDDELRGLPEELYTVAGPKGISASVVIASESARNGARM